MRNPFGKSQRGTPKGPAYDYRLFLTTDARQNALDDDNVILLSQSGLAGLVPLWEISAAQSPTGFDYATNIIGLGGTNSPVDVPQPLVYSPQFAQIFLQENSELTGM
jgi:hypothetical protein